MEIKYACDCILPKVVLDDESGNECCLICGGVIRDEDIEMENLNG